MVSFKWVVKGACCPIGWLCQGFVTVHSRFFREVAQDGVRDGERLAARPGTRWYAAETGASVTLGDEVELRGGDVAVDGDAALFKRGGNWPKALAWRAEDVPDRVEALRSRQRREVPQRTSSPHRSDTPRQDDTGIRGRSTAVGNQHDARTLWIDWDGHGERYKTWRTACEESRQLDHAGLGLGGEGTALHMAEMMERQGGNRRLWAERWLREKGSERDSRTGHGFVSRWGLRSAERGRFGVSGGDLSSHCGAGGSTQSTESTKLDSGSIPGGCAHE